MRRGWLARTTLAVALGIIIWILLPQDAAADDNDPVPKITASEVTTECDHGGPYPDRDVWIFAGPGGTQFESATFVGESGQVEVLTAADRAYDLAGHSVMWLSAPAGWRLTDITPADLRVAGACPAADAPPPQPASDLAKAKNEPAVRNEPGVNNEPGVTNQPAAKAGPADKVLGSSPAQLPQTGQDVTAMVVLGSALIATGVVLLFVRRKRPSPPRQSPRRDDRLVWTYPE